MKNKLFIFVAVFISSLFIAGSCFAGERACSRSFWSGKCQNFIHKRDHKNNIKQIPRKQRAEFKRCSGGEFNHNFGSGNSCGIVLKYPNLVYDY